MKEITASTGGNYFRHHTSFFLEFLLSFLLRLATTVICSVGIPVLEHIASVLLKVLFDVFMNSKIFFSSILNLMKENSLAVDKMIAAPQMAMSMF